MGQGMNTPGSFLSAGFLGYSRAPPVVTRLGHTLFISALDSELSCQGWPAFRMWGLSDAQSTHFPGESWEVSQSYAGHGLTHLGVGPKARGWT